jgi:hypothetical protein
MTRPSSEERFMSGRDRERAEPGADGGRQEEAAGPAEQRAGAMPQLHPDPGMSRALLQRRVQRRAAAQSSAGSAGPVIQRKPKDSGDSHGASPEPPSGAGADQATIHALQSHMKLTATQMYAVAANMRTILHAPTNTDAGVAPIIQGLQQQFDTIIEALDRLYGEIARVPNLMRGAMSEEISLLRGAWHDNNGLAAALSSVYSFTHDKEGRLTTDATGMTVHASDVQNKLKTIYEVLHIDEADITAHYLPRGTDVATAVGAARSEALDDGVYAMQLCARRITADLSSMEDKDANEKAAELLSAVSATVAAAKAIDAKNLGAVKKAVSEVEALQAELAKRQGAKIETLAKKIGYNSMVSVNLHALHQRMDQVAKEGKHR